MYNKINKCTTVAVVGASTAPVLRHHSARTAPVLRQYSASTGAVLGASTV